MRQTLNADVGEDGVKVTVNDLIVKACALALEKFPEVNSSLKEDYFVRYKHINIGMAIDAPTGLVVPVIRDTNAQKREGQEAALPLSCIPLRPSPKYPRLEYTAPRRSL